MPYKDINKGREYSRNYYYKNPAKGNLKRLERKQKNPFVFNARNAVLRIKQRHNIIITLDEYLNLFKKGGGVCEICKETSNKTLALDHCHKTNKVRGFLCYKCNQGIGFFNDDISILQNAIKYLKEKGVK